jgi:hypothetical protein
MRSAVPTTSSSATPRAHRHLWLLGFFGVLLLGAGIVWATEPGRRRGVRFAAPIRLAEGVLVQGSFVPEPGEPTAIQVRFPEARLRLAHEPDDGALDALGSALGGGWWRSRSSPPGLTASWIVRDGGGAAVAAGATGDRLTGFMGGRASGLYIAWIEDLEPGRHDVEVRIERAVADLATWEAHLEVTVAGDWISYAWLEELGRWALLLILVLLTLATIGARKAWRRWKARNRLAESAHGGMRGRV